MTTLSDQLAEIAGPALGALIVSTSGSPTAFTLDGLSFVISALCLAPLVRLALAGHASKERKSVLHDFREGVEVVRKASWLSITIVIASLGNITLSAPFAIAPSSSKVIYMAALGLGLLYSLLAAGSIGGTILGTVWLERTSGLRARGLLAYGLWIAGGLLIAVFGLPVTIYAVAPAAFLIGVAFGVPNLIFINLAGIDSRQGARQSNEHRHARLDCARSGSGAASSDGRRITRARPPSSSSPAS